MILSELRLGHPGIEPEDVVFFDDSQSKVDTACEVGINGQLYIGVDQVRRLLGVK